jgi:hypothetical protein
LAVLEIASMLRNASPNAAKLVGNSEVAGTRLLLPTHIARKVVDPDVWIAEAHRDWEQSEHASREGYNYYGMQKEAIGPFIHGVCQHLKIEKTVNNHSFLATPNCPESGLKFPNFIKDAYFLEACLIPNNRDDSLSRVGPITERWEKIIRQPIIPFDRTVRRGELKHAYKVLEQFIASHKFMRRKRLLH